MNPPPPPPYACSFCGKSRKEVRYIVSGPQVWICDECIGLCHDIVAGHEDREDEKLWTEMAQLNVSLSELEHAERALATLLHLNRSVRVFVAKLLKDRDTLKKQQEKIKWLYDVYADGELTVDLTADTLQTMIIEESDEDET